MSGAEPKFIEVEKDFARFVRTFRGGAVVRDLIPDAPHMEPNADYYFSNDDIVAELKCLALRLATGSNSTNGFCPFASVLAIPPNKL
jgi:hypothetical protein